ncbi:MAG: hypothetical protein ACJ735_06230 [Actinomycetes bacterium]
MKRTARQVFLSAGWTFAVYNFFGMAVGVLADLPPCNGEACSTAHIVHQAVLGNGTALSPPLFLSVVWVLVVLAASRRGLVGAVGGFLLWFSAVFYVSAGQLGELTSTTSPLTGWKWGLVIALGSLGMAIAAVISIAGIWWAFTVVKNRRSDKASSARGGGM